MKSIRQFAVATLMLATAITSTALAQDQTQQQGPWTGWMMGGWGPGGMMGRGFGGSGPWMMGGWGQAMCDAMAGHVEGRLAYVKAELKIVQDQEALWNAYAAAARDNADTMATRCTTMVSRRSGAATLSLPDRLDQDEQLMAAQLDAVRAVNKALKPLYAALTDTQRKAADRLFWSPMSMM
ncbi:MAG: Spy/CpxP family protein refolding chaperone [Bradyrhizobiaceae bacterium]|nr:Spy/CpxP family protein refolding chaperone [Bradyrhizobiaceae bacterium]